MQTNILQNIICAANPAVLAKNWEARERIGYHLEGFHLEPPLLERELERLEREISDFQEKFSQLQPTKGTTKWVAIASTGYCLDVPYTYAAFFKKGDFKILLERAVAADVSDRFEEDAPPEYYDKILLDWAQKGQDVIHGRPVAGTHGLESLPENISRVKIYPSNIDHHDKDLFVSDILWWMTFNDRYIHVLPEWKTDPEVEAAKRKADKEYKYKPTSREEQDKYYLQQSKDAARDYFVQIMEFRRLYKEIYKV